MSHDLLQALAIFAAGLAAGTINTVVGSGTLITFPTLLAFGYPPVVANVSNNVGLVPGGVSGAVGYRAELKGQRRRVIRLGAASLCGGLVGAILLLVLPAAAFKEIVPALIGIALVMVVFQPRLSKWVAARQAAQSGGADGPDGPGAAGGSTAVDGGPTAVDGGPTALAGSSTAADGGSGTVGVVTPVATQTIVQVGGPVLWVLVFLSGVYGGYFGAAQGVLLLGLMGVAFTDSMQRINATKNVLAGLVNGVAAVVFIVAGHVNWGVAGLIAAGSILGGQVGARVGRKLPPWGLRVLIVCVGTAALVKLLA
ncbi:sulfite exporter TauE/SafE family protein [Trebonia kvetii]|uniref:Probable membrane transporter protein n=1 Tax=Trebonia kvetii TaxID=2480626 RepID=A0A6P2BXR8_9ACTN|nr:sulfite exporter TauE/SafE family protein [Trebonia kvetii]TVZ02985.1 sulfite exporter TauE/SafE family protein [Trebonia kvetii]